jgi:DNA-directed RNA polymerase subunit RPC12/RpoP
VPVLVLQLLDIQPKKEIRPTYCPYCGSEVLQRWGSSVKLVQDTSQQASAVYRYKCNKCGHFFRNYPPKIDHTNLTPRIRKLAALAWAFGLSSRQVVSVFGELGIEISHMTVWRDGHELIASVANNTNPERPRRYLIDKLFLRNKSRGIGTSIVIDLGQGKTTVLGKIDEPNPRVVLSWLEPFIKNLDVQTLLFDTNILSNFDES